MINQIAQRIIDRYVSYKKGKLQNMLMRCVILYSKKELKMIMQCFHKLKHNHLKDNNNTKAMKSNMKLIQIKYSTRKFRKENNTKQKLDLSHDFFSRQSEYNKKQNMSREKIMKQHEELINELCPFNPHIYSKKIFQSVNSNISAYKRLYDDGLKRIEKEKANCKRYNSNNNAKKKLDNKTFEKLYEDFKRRKINNRKLINQVNEEMGLTFSPETNHKLSKKCLIHNQDINNQSRCRSPNKGNVNKRNCNFIYDIVKSQNKSINK